MAMTTFKVDVTSSPDLSTCSASARDFKLDFNLAQEPDEITPNPGVQINEGVLRALGACETIVARAFHNSQSLRYQDLYLTLDGTNDGSFTLPRLDEIKINLHFKTDSSQTDCDEFAEFMESRCPIYDNLTNSVPIKWGEVNKE